MRAPPALAALTLLAACQEQANVPPEAQAERIECALGGAPSFERNCAVETAQSPDGPAITIRHPDGGFRRLLVTSDGRGVVAADGAEPAQVVVTGERGIEVAIGGDRYRLPATIRPGAQQGR